jgi:SAM-dependent methyltransferase
MSYDTNSLEPDFAQNAAFHDQVAAQYDSQMLGNRHNVLARAAFRDLVSRYVPSGSTLLDFGCGTGCDALHYARQSYRVLAYDNSPGMVAQLEQRCPTEIAAGQILTCSTGYPSFPAGLPPWPAPQAITANFAVLNSIRELQPLFDSFARLLAPPGWLIVSVLNPIHWSKMRMPAWWRNALPHRTGPRPYGTKPYATYLHSVSALLGASRGFHLVGRANAGALVRHQRPNEQPIWWRPEGFTGSRWERIVWRTPAYRLFGHFVFLVWRRDL